MKRLVVVSPQAGDKARPLPSSPARGLGVGGQQSTTDWLTEDAKGIVLTLHIQPGAKRSEIVGPHGHALKIRLAAAPVEGQANAALIDFLAAKLGAGKAALSLLSGASARAKRLRVTGVSAADALRALSGA